jgi:6,7-dimethyl-8-ribityllumazine synthase
MSACSSLRPASTTASPTNCSPARPPCWRRLAAASTSSPCPARSKSPSAIVIGLRAADEAVDPYEAVVALGTVIRGETGHYDIVAGESSRALMDLSVAFALPLGNGILTVENEAQAWARANRSEMDKGGGAAEAALAVLRYKRSLAEESK